MSMPGFTADASLYKKGTHYNINIANLSPHNAEANILPQLIKGTGTRPGNPTVDSLCGQMADIINEGFAERNRHEMTENFTEAALWGNHALDLLERGTRSTACSFSVA